MSIQPVGDLVLDVLKEADPLASSRARHALARPAKVAADLPVVTNSGNVFASNGSDFSFADEMQKAENKRAPLSPLARGGLSSSSADDVITAMQNNTTQRKDSHKLGEKLEAAVLQTFVQNMLPQEMESVYGGGTAGSIWKSMMAEQLANQIAKNGVLGLADKVLPDAVQKQENEA
ncbi:rod-binding protein [Polycladidibacter stylochi]|uniref:rod-binding protein n=1 Tax=Polycladidibacter stylochi TaxID=1807766 RepID=UPI00083241E8|nr:rod-binding protein [Pseudovibrio stylochi]